MNLTELARLARDATPGPWKTGKRAHMALDPDTWEVMAGNFYITDAISRDAFFIAAANPQTILRMIECMEAMAEALKAACDYARDYDEYAFVAGEQALAKYKELKG